MITRSKKWRVAGLFSHDIFYWSRHVNKMCRINFSSGATAVLRNMGPHFTTKVIPISAHASAHPSSGSYTPGGTLVTTSTSPMTNTRSHKFTVTQPRLIKTELEEAFMSVRHDDVSICCLQHPFLFYSLTDWNNVLNTMTAMTAFLEIYVLALKLSFSLTVMLKIYDVFSSITWRPLCRKLGPTISIRLSSQLLMV